MLARNTSDIIVALDGTGLQQVKLQVDNTLAMGIAIKSNLYFMILATLGDKVLAAIIDSKSGIETGCCFNRRRTIVEVKLVITDNNGKILKNVATERTKNKSDGMLAEASAIATSPDHNIIYLLTGYHVYGKDKCVAMSLDRQIIFTYQDEMHAGIRGICMGPEGFVFLSVHKNKVIMLNDKGEKLEDIINVPLRDPQSSTPDNEFVGYIAFDKSSRKLYVDWKYWYNENRVLAYKIIY